MARPSILVVDDQAEIRELVAAFLEGEGYLVRTARHGREALEVLQREIPALILLDLRMPVMDGWAFARELRRRGLWIPLVVMTAATDPDRWAGQVQAAGCLPKPFELDSLLRIVQDFTSEPLSRAA